MVKSGAKIIDQRYYDNINAVGGCSGIFIADSQPVPNFFILSKYGDYDGSIIIINDKGKILEKSGGVFYISKDKRYLFSNYDSDAAGLTVYDLLSGKVLYSNTSEIAYSLGDWYYQDGKYIARAYNYNDLEEDSDQVRIATYNLSSGKITFSFITRSLLLSSNALSFYGGYHEGQSCNCGK